MKKVVSILVFLGMGAFVSGQKGLEGRLLPDACYEAINPNGANQLWRGTEYLRIGGQYIEWNEKSICGEQYNSNRIGWNSSDFEAYLRRYTIKYGEPIYKDTSRGYDMIWCWSVDKDYILNLRYVVPNSLAPAGIIIYVTKK